MNANCINGAVVIGFLGAAVALAAPASAAVWVGPNNDGNSGGAWTTATNWNPQSVPNAATDSAIFNGALDNDKITIASDVTVASIHITNTANYNPLKFEGGAGNIKLAAGGTFTLASTGAGSGGSHNYGNDIILLGDATFDIQTAKHTFRNGGSLSGAASKLTKTGAGQLHFITGSTVFDLDMQAGTLTLRGSALTVDNLALVAGSGATVDLGSTAASTWHALRVGNVNISPGTYTAAELNELSGTTVFTGTTGTITVAQLIPEPASLAVVSLSGLLLARRRTTGRRTTGAIC